MRRHRHDFSLVFLWVTSAVACKMAIEFFGSDSVRVIYFKIDQVHPDNDRFIKDCEDWYGVKIEQIQGKYKTPLEVAAKLKYLNGPAGARCTFELKKKLRQDLDKSCKYDGQIFGFEFSPRERSRAQRFKDQYPASLPLYPLIVSELNKQDCLRILADQNIDYPAMHKLGYHNNNCIGCFKGSMGYWNKIKVDFPEIFNKTMQLERNLGHHCIKGIYLDELDPGRGRAEGPLVPECGIFCELEGDKPDEV